MSRNNSQRLGVNPGNKDTGTPPTNEFSFIAPTEMVDLPSRGALYPQGHPLYGSESVEIRFMTAKEEDILLNENYIKKNVVIEKFLESVLVNKNIKPDSMLVGDKNAIIIAARVSGYGDRYNTTVNCPKCGEGSRFDFSLSNHTVYNGDDYDNSEIRPTDNGTFMVKAPLCGAEVEFRPMNGSDEKHFSALLADAKRRRSATGIITQQLMKVVVSVNGETDPQYLRSFAEKAPARDSSYIRNALKQVTPDIDLSQNFECSACDYEGTIGVPLNAEFFWPDR